jgi:UDPglucose 6-dehydrogenase
MEKVELFESEYACLEGADALVICTEWNEYRNPDLKRIMELLKSPVIIDGRNLYKPEKMRRLGFIYYTVGRPSPPRD